MQKLLQTVIDKVTAGKTFSESADEMYLYLTLSVAVVFAGGMHIFLLIAMLLLGVKLFVILNCVSILIYGSLLHLVLNCRRYRLVGNIIAVEVIAYAMFASVYLGKNCYFFLYFFLLLLVQLNVPYETKEVRIFNSAAAFIAMVASVVMAFRIEPFYVIQSQIQLVALAVANCTLCFMGILIELLVIDIIRKGNAERVRTYEKRAHTDSLTGIYNRWYADGFIADFAKGREDSSWCVAIMDIDDFKTINDTWGHQAGDEVLRMLANILSSSFRKTDVVFRWGGEEFLVFLSDVKLKTATSILDVVRKRIADTPVLVANKRISYTVTIGIAEVDFNDVASSIVTCDEMLYQGKRNGKNQVVT